MSRSTKVVSLSLSEGTYRTLEKWAKIREASRSELVQTLINKYSQEELDKLWGRIRKGGKEIRRKYNVKSEEDILKIIHARRSSEGRF